MRDRPTVAPKAQQTVRIAQIASSNPPNFNWKYLFQSLKALYPTMDCSDVAQIELQQASEYDWDLLWLTQQQLYSLNSQKLVHLRQSLAAGCTLTIEISSQETSIAELTAVKHRLQSALVDAKLLKEFPDIPQQIEAELHACEAKLSEQVQEITQTMGDIFPQLKDGLAIEQQSVRGNISLDKDIQSISDCVENLTADINELAATDSGAIGRGHPLRNTPFLFGQFPTINEQSIQIFNWGGIILVIGDLSSAWGLNQQLNLSRENIRTAQEMGINLLHFAWQKRHLTNLMQ